MWLGSIWSVSTRCVSHGQVNTSALERTFYSPVPPWPSESIAETCDAGGKRSITCKWCYGEFKGQTRNKRRIPSLSGIAIAYAPTAAEMVKRTRRSCGGTRISATGRLMWRGGDGKNLRNFGSQPEPYIVNYPTLFAGH